MRPIFPTPRIYRQRAEGVEHPAGRRGRRLWVLSRALCRYRTFPLVEDRGKRLAALDLAIAEWSPYHETGRLIQEAEARAGVWIWDRAAVSAAIIAAGERPQRLEVFPETALQPRGGDGLRLIAGLDGYEGQWWDKGLIVASRWWAQMPSASEWLQFRRASGVPPEMPMETPGKVHTIGMLPTPWIASTSRGRGISVPRRAYQALGAAYLILLGVGLGQFAWDYGTLASLRRQLSEAETRADPRAADRAAARSGADAITALQSLDPFPSQLELFAAVSTIVPAAGAQVTSWNFSSGELEFTLISANPLDAVASVRALETAGFHDVSAARANADRTLRLKVKVSPR